MSNDKLENIIGSGIPITIKGKEYKLGVFGMRDLADFRQYIKGQRIKIIQESIVNDADRYKAINDTLDGNVNETKELSTMDGVCFMLWKSLQKYQPEMTLKNVDDLIDLNNISEISNVIMKIGGQVKNPPMRAKKK
uniref:Uncharacterized protein n=1 Tax=viral metagenome TaxID=1070528 RepID=A0A6H1ZSU4_9ZZZZ